VEDKRLAVVRLLQSYNANLPKFGVLFDKVTYDVTLKKKRFRGVAKQRRILNQISGLIVPGVCVQCRMHGRLHGVHGIPALFVLCTATGGSARIFWCRQIIIDEHHQ